jgi:hypothetical protein
MVLGKTSFCTINLCKGLQWCRMPIMYIVCFVSSALSLLDTLSSFKQNYFSRSRRLSLRSLRKMQRTSGKTGYSAPNLSTSDWLFFPMPMEICDQHSKIRSADQPVGGQLACCVLTCFVFLSQGC